jgi:hypothetical protein
MMNAQEIYLDDDKYDEIIDQIYGKFQIGVCSFDASRILKELDPIAYNCGKSDVENMEGCPKYMCDECGGMFDTEDEAEECCQEE